LLVAKSWQSRKILFSFLVLRRAIRIIILVSLQDSILIVTEVLNIFA
jgi:hypothetical protein